MLKRREVRSGRQEVSRRPLAHLPRLCELERRGSRANALLPAATCTDAAAGAAVVGCKAVCRFARSAGAGPGVRRKNLSVVLPDLFPTILGHGVAGNGGRSLSEFGKKCRFELGAE